MSHDVQLVPDSLFSRETYFINALYTGVCNVQYLTHESRLFISSIQSSICRYINIIGTYLPIHHFR